MKNAFADFNVFIKNQMAYGSKKYAKTDQKEATDVLFDAHGFSWLIGTVDKYTERYLNLARERDMLKIPAYSYIIWLKRGFHKSDLGTKTPINTTIEAKDKFFSDFILGVYNYYESNRFYLETMDTVGAVLKISEVLRNFSKEGWESIGADNLYQIYCLSFVVWHNEYYKKGNAGKDTDTYNEEKMMEEVLLKSAVEFFGKQEQEEDLHLLVKSQVKAIMQKRK